METHGLSLLKYLPHPKDNTNVVNVINNHGLFHKKGVKQCNKIATKYYNSYELANQQDVIKFLTNLASPNLKLKLLITLS